MAVRTRFAPSPTGYLHLGHAFSALTAYDFARHHGGEFILRIEDIDHTRCRPAFEQAIYDDLHWLGLDWLEPVLRQSEHLVDYQAALDRLRNMGVLYADSRTRKGQAEAALSALQEDDATSDPAPAQPAWRLSVEAAQRHIARPLVFTDLATGEHAAQPTINGDVILGRKDIGVAYHLAVVIDDARQGITHVVRGQDLFDATHTQVLLQALLGLTTPQYFHHPLLLDDQGRRLAKRKGSKALRDYRDDGQTADGVREMLDQTPKT